MQLCLFNAYCNKYKRIEIKSNKLKNAFSHKLLNCFLNGKSIKMILQMESYKKKCCNKILPE